MLIKTVNKMDIYFLVALLLASLYLFIFMIWVTDSGVGVSPDSTVYLKGAESILNGNGFSDSKKSITHFPPAYSYLLATIASLSNVTAIEAARYIGASFYGLNFILFVLIVYISTKRNALTSTITGLFYACSLEIMKTHSMAWSEPPFITIMLITIIFLVIYIKTLNNYLLLAISQGVAISILIRYVGVIMIPFVIISLLLFIKKSLKYRIKICLIFILLSLPFLCAWLVRNILIAKSATNRTIGFHPVTILHFKNLIVTTENFIVNLPFNNPWGKSIALLFTTILIIILLINLLYRKNVNMVSFSLPILLTLLPALLGVIYVVSIILSISFFDALTPCDYRIMLPAFLLLTITLSSCCCSSFKLINSSFVKFFALCLICLFLCINAAVLFSASVEIHTNGQEINSRSWRNFKIIKDLSVVSNSLTIYTNAPAAVNFLTKKKAFLLPFKYSALTLRNNPNFQVQFQNICSECKKGNILIVLFYDISRSNLPTISSFKEEGLPVLSKYNQCIVFGYKLSKLP